MLRPFLPYLHIRRLASVCLIAFMMLLAGRVSATENSLPVGTVGWWYYIDIWHVGYASNPVEACTLTALNHHGRPLLDMTAPSGRDLTMGCKYYSLIDAGGPGWYGITFLACEPGYTQTPDGICAKAREPAPPLSCKPGQPGFMVGNPVVVSTGAKVQTETDGIASVSASLRVERTYRTFRTLPKSTSGGQSWSFWFDRAFVPSTIDNAGRPQQIDATGSDGTFFMFTWDAATQKYQPIYDKQATLSALTPSYDDWLLVHDGQVDRYQKRIVGDGAGFVLVSSQRFDGSIQNYVYKPDSYLLQEIIDERGRKLVVTWGSKNQVTSISGPNGSANYYYDFPWGDFPSTSMGTDRCIMPPSKENWTL